MTIYIYTCVYMFNFANEFSKSNTVNFASATPIGHYNGAKALANIQVL
jgi:hypothetical protein